MRGLLKASLLLAPALATAFVVPEAVDEDTEVDRIIADHSFALIGVEVPSRSPDDWVESLAFRLDVFPSEAACGLGNVTVDGQVLPQTLDGGIASGKGPITTDRKNIIAASWSFHCVKVNGQPDSQFLKFIVDLVDGESVEDVGFTALFRQTGSTEIINIETDLTLDDQVAANPNPDGLQPVGHEDDEFPRYSIEQEIDELQWLRAQMKELEYLIWTKERAIAEHASAYFEEEIRDCDSLKCLAKTVVDKARKAAHKVFKKIHGHHGHHDFEDEEFDHFSKFRPHWPKKPKHGKPGNHTCPPKHGNHTAPPHWKKPPHRPLPICRYPPPPKKGGPHPKPPHHPPPPPPPHGGKLPPPPPPPKHDDMPPPPPGPHEGPHGGPPGGPDREMGPPHEPLPDGPHDEPDREIDPPHGPPGHGGPPHDGPHHGPGDKPEFDRPPPPPGFEPEAPFQQFGGPPGPPRHHPFDGSGPRHNGLSKAFHVVKFVVIGVLLSLFVIALHRRTCNPKRRADRQARREERHRRRAFRRAAHKHAITRFFSRISGHDIDEDSDDYEEKRQALLASAAEDGMSTTMTEEITELRNAAEVVDDMVSAESSRAQPIPIPAPAPATEDRPLLRDYDIGSLVGDGEELPAYEDNDGSEMSSVVADGFRYTPGSTEYSPSHSPAGSVSDILGPDTKQ